MREEPDALGATTVGEMLAQARFEVVPMKRLVEQERYLPHGATVTVTSSPWRGIEPTLEATENLASRGFRAVPHLCARQVVDHAHLGEILDRLRGAGIQELFVVGGDAREPAGRYQSASELLEAMADRRDGFGRIGVAGYPEKHPIVPEGDLLEALRAKQRHADYVVSQICFDAAVVLGWIAALRRSGVRLPVYIGMTGPLKRRKLLEVALRVGVGDSIRFVAGKGSLVARLALRRNYRPDRFVASVSSLLGAESREVAGFHLNTFNQVEAAERWRRRLLAAYGWSGTIG